MAIIKDVTVKINNGTATLDAPVQFYEKDHDVELRFRLMDYKYKYDKDPQNILNSVDEDILEAYTTIVNPRGYELEQINGVVKNDVVIFRLDPTYTDELDELGTYKLQIHIKCTHSEFTIPPITFEVLQRLKGIKVVTDGEDEVDNSEILDNSSKFVSDETGKLIIEWKKGDMISSAKLNAMVDVINDAVDEEKIRQENEIEREKKANNKIQELENTRVEYVNKFDDELDSFADQVDTTMSDYETRFNALTVSQQQDAEIIDARDGEQTLRARLDRDIQKPSIIYEEVEGSYINVDTTCGYAKNVEIIGNTIQNQNDLADIRSVGDKLENQELYEIPVLSANKNLFSYDFYDYSSYSQLDNAYVLKEIKLPVGIITISNKKIKEQTSDMGNLVMQFWDNTTYSTSTRKPMINSGWVASSQNIITIEEGKKYYIAINITGNTLNKETILEKVKDMYEIQIEVGDTVTPYEPCQEDKLTILSPVQLEKVGDIADRIICKDGVWGVEKNVKDFIVPTSLNWRKYDVGLGDNLISANCDTLPGDMSDVVREIDGSAINNKFLVKRGNGVASLVEEGIFLRTDSKILFVKGLKNTFTTHTDLGKFVEGSLIKYPTTQPQFIPLPHDQQVKLRTFANKTNISFGCEIEPTLKAQVPKSLGASVSSHSEQIDNLSKELDKVKKLEESATSTVTTESDFTTVEQTSNGYFEDVKLEGKTLVNLAQKDNQIGTESNKFAFDGQYYSIQKGSNTVGLKFSRMGNDFIFGETVTIIVDNKSDIPLSMYTVDYKQIKALVNGINVFKLNIENNMQRISLGRLSSGEGLLTFSVIILEGDHTQNPPEYFEGLKSVGDGVDEVSVLSCNENLFDFNTIEPKMSNVNGQGGSKPESYTLLENGVNVTSLTAYTGVMFRCKLKRNHTYTISWDGTGTRRVLIKPITPGDIYQYNETIAQIAASPYAFITYTFTTNDANEFWFIFDCETKTGDWSITNIMLVEGSSAKPYKPHKQNKKPILYYNEETQTWEKPVLREWDSIEKHSDGKYYYHKRSGEIHSSQIQKINKVNTTYDNNETITFSIPTVDFNWKKTNGGHKAFICDKFNVYDYKTIIGNGSNSIVEGMTCEITYSTIYCRVYKSKLSSQDTEGFKAYLQVDPITVVYQLAEEKVYECTDLDLITYQNETNLMVKGGAIVPKTTLKKHQNIANIATILQEKVNRLENNVGHVNGEIDNINTDLTSLTESIEGSCISVDSKDGHLKDIEILGNTVQDQDNLADIRSVGDKLENQELYEIPVLSTGKNLTNMDIKIGIMHTSDGSFNANNSDYYSNVNFDVVKQNTQYAISSDKTINVVFFYDKDMKYISNQDIQTTSKVITTPSECRYIRYRFVVSNKPTWIQLEEGTVATPYEPYQEHKLTILSPTPLERVGDVADRIVCKDGVWGVEKNIKTYVFSGNEFNGRYTFNNGGVYFKANIISGILYSSWNVLCNNAVGKQLIAAYNDLSTYAIYFDAGGYFRITGADFQNMATTNEANEWAKSKGLYIKYPTTQPTFVPLPYDQQVKLRTFANKTNISFGCEIEPTLKASVPKSLSSTVSTHTEQIDNLSKELDKVKKLEESVASEVVTKSDFTTVENTSNGYFEDVKIEGKTLVNLYPKLDAKNYTSLGATLSNDTITIDANGGWKNLMIKKDVMPLKTSTYYTFVIHIIDNTIEGDNPIIHFGETLQDSDPTKFEDSYHFSLKNKKGIYAFKLKTKDSFDNAGLDTRDHLTDKATSGTIVFKFMILEGDHTQNPPSYFEGIKSVGQDVEEISVESRNINLYNVDNMVDGKYLDQVTGDVVSIAGRSCSLEYIPIKKNTLYFNQYEPIEQLIVHCYNINKTHLKCITIGKVTSKTLALPEGTTFIRLAYAKLKAECRENGIYLGSIDINYKPHQSNKKPLLYYNPTSETWEKPILREWDTIEKHSDGKYYYHKRSGEVVLNGSENWADYGPSASNESSKCFYVSTPISRPLKGDYMCDRLSTGVYNADLNDINDITKVTNSLYFNTDPKYSKYAYIRVELSKLSSQDVAGFKTWLQANNVTVVYQLEEEKVYECINIDLITYENETNFIVNTGAISPKSTLKVMCNITNVVRELQQKVSNLENYIQHVMIDALNNALNE